MKPEEQLLSGLLDHIQIDETRKQEQIHQLMQEAAHMEPQPKKSLLAQILVQSGYLSRWMLIVQAAFLALGLLLLSGEELQRHPASGRAHPGSLWRHDPGRAGCGRGA